MKQRIETILTPRLAVSATALMCLILPVSPAMSGNISVGLGAGYSAAEYKGIGSESSTIPIVEYEVGRFSFYALGASVRLATISFSPETDAGTNEQESRYNLHLLGTINLADDERDNNDSPVFTDMEIREFGSSAGISALLETPLGVFSVAHQTDISDSSNGSVTTLGYGFPLYGSSRFFIGGNIGVNIFDEKWNDYYYGVRDSEASISRAAYKGSSSVNHFAQISATYAFDQHWSMSQEATLTKLDNTVVDSPLTVSDDTLSEVTFRLQYTF